MMPAGGNVGDVSEEEEEEESGSRCYSSAESKLCVCEWRRHRM
jgi:hypothetical protein